MTTEEMNVNDEMSLAELLREFQDWSQQNHFKEFADYLHDLSAPLHVASFCADEWRKKEGQGGSKLVREKLESSLNNLSELVLNKRQVIKDKRQRGSNEKEQWERFLSAPFEYVDAYGNATQMVTIHLENGQKKNLYESELDLLNLCGFYLLTRNLGAEFSRFLETYFVDQEVPEMDPLSLEITMNGGTQMPMGFEYELVLGEVDEQWKDFFRGFLSTDDKMVYNINSLSSGVSRVWKVQDISPSGAEGLKGKMGLEPS